jgi:hypothetical protein
MAEGMLCFVDLFNISSANESRSLSMPASSTEELGSTSNLNALAFIGNYPLRRQAIRTMSDLSGNQCVEAVKIDYQGKTRIVFPFPVRSIRILKTVTYTD